MINPEIGCSIRTGPIQTNYHDRGTGAPVLLIHGSGPGVSAWANWRLTIGALEGEFRCIAPDMAGFGFSPVPEDWQHTRAAWLDQLIAFMDGLGIAKAHVIGNSFGGSMALALAIAYPERVDRLVLMGSVGVPFALTAGLDAVWGYTPGVENMKALLRIFAWDQGLADTDLARIRYEASIRPGVQEAYAAMFPATAPALGRCHGAQRKRYPGDPPAHTDRARPRRQGDPAGQFADAEPVDRQQRTAHLWPLQALDPDRTRRWVQSVGARLSGNERTNLNGAIVQNAELPIGQLPKTARVRWLK